MGASLIYNPYSQPQPDIYEQWEQASGQLDRDYQRMDPLAQARFNELRKKATSLEKALDTGRLRPQEFERGIADVYQQADRFKWVHHIRPEGESIGDIIDDNGIQKMRTEKGVQLVGLTPDYIKKNTIKLDADGSMAVPVKPGEYKIIERNQAQIARDVAEASKTEAEKLATINDAMVGGGGEDALVGGATSPQARDEADTEFLNQYGMTKKEADQFILGAEKVGKTKEEIAQELQTRGDVYNLLKEKTSVVDPGARFASQLVAATQIEKPFQAATKEEMERMYGNLGEGTVVELPDGRRYVKDEGRFWQVPWTKEQIAERHMIDESGRPIIDPRTGAPAAGIVQQLESGAIQDISPAGQMAAQATRPPVRREEAIETAAATAPATRPPVRREEAIETAAATAPARAPVTPSSFDETIDQAIREARPEPKFKPPSIVEIKRALQNWQDIPAVARRAEDAPVITSAAQKDDVKNMPDGSVVSIRGKLYYKYGNELVELPTGRAKMPRMRSGTAARVVAPGF